MSSALLAKEQKYDIVVDRNGTGNYRNIQEALDEIRAFNPEGWVTVFIKNSVYKEKLVLPTHLTQVRLIGEDKDKTIITYDDHANIDNMGTFNSYSFLIRGNDIVLENLTIENAAAPLGQAVACHVEGDRIVFKNCRLLGNQDTLYAGRESCRLFFQDCYLEGTTDFIFGPATCWFENCELFCKKDSYITAANTPQNSPYGYIFNRCQFVLADGVSAVYLGRPWRAYAMTLFMNCVFPEGIHPTGWHNWGKEENEKTARYMEFNNSGKGAQTGKRVHWAKQLSPKEAATYTIENVMKGCDGWNPLHIIQ